MWSQVAAAAGSLVFDLEYARDVEEGGSAGEGRVTRVSDN